MAAIDVMPLSTSDYLADTGHLNTMQHGAYLLILCAMWRAGGWIDDDEKKIILICKTTTDKWRKIKTEVRALLMSRDGKLSQKRLLLEYEAEVAKRAKLRGNFGTGSDANVLKTNGATSSKGDLLSEAAPSFLDDDSESQIEKKESKEGTRSRRAPRAVMRQDWTPSDHGLLFAKSKGFSADRIVQLARGCLLYHRKHGTLIADLEATWEHWVEKQIIFDETRRRQSKNSGPSFTDIARGI